MKPTSPLDEIRIARPCPADWSKMTGDDRARFCSQCRLHVYDFSAMTRGEAEELFLEKEGRLCVRLWRRRDGTVITSDCPEGVRLARRRRWRVVAVGAAILSCLAGLAALAGGSRWRGRPLRSIEPFATILEWIDPTPPMAGSPCPPPTGP